MRIVINICFLIFASLLKGAFLEPPGYTQGFLQGTPCVKARNGTNECYGKDSCSFFLYTRKNRNNPEFLHCSGNSLPNNTYFNASHPTKIIIHGATDGMCRTAWMRETMLQILNEGCYNILLVDATPYFGGFDRVAAVQSTYIVANEITLVVANIMKNKGVVPETFHIIAHSLGSYVAGYIGSNIPGLGEISALDPRGQIDANFPTEIILTPASAKLVSIIHTSIESNCEAAKNGRPPAGHADFYVNGGSNQSSCRDYALDSIKKGDIPFGLLMLFLPLYCDHLMAIVYYKLSINSCDCQFVGVKCGNYTDLNNCAKVCGGNPTNCAVMGYHFSKYWQGGNSTKNVYAVNTTTECPYCDNSNIDLTGYPIEKEHCFGDPEIIC